MLPATAYTMLVCVVGQFFMKIPISETLASGFGNERMGWLLVFLLSDVLGRILGLYK